MITVTRTTGTVTEHLYGEDDKELSFNTFKEALKYLADRNYTLQELVEPGINFEFKEEAHDASDLVCVCGSRNIEIQDNLVVAASPDSWVKIYCQDCGNGLFAPGNREEVIKEWEKRKGEPI